MRIIFMGTPDFAVPSLKILLDNGFEVVGVVTAPDRPGGRMGTLQSAVKQFAVARHLKVLQPVKLRDPEFLEELRGLKADLQVVVAFRMLPEMVWNMPQMGTLNLHGSLLPRYRGAAPINRAIMNGDTETGVTTFFLQHEIDTGDVIMQRRMPIGPDETAGEVHDRMMELGAEVVLETVTAIKNGTVTTSPQLDTEASHAPKIFTETCKIDFNQPAKKVYDFIRGLSPYPGAWTELNGKVFKIFRCVPVCTSSEHALGQGIFSTDEKNYIRIWATDGYIDLLEVQLEGKRRMAVKELLNGHKNLFSL